MARYLFQSVVCFIFILIFSISIHAQPQQSGDSSFLPVEIEDQWGYIDEAGEMVISPRFDEAEYFSDGLAKVKTGENYYFIDEGGNTVLEPNVDFVTSFSEGLAVASTPDSKLLGYINKQGQFVVEPQFDKAFSFSEGKAAVSPKAKDAFGYINKEGNFIIEPRFDGARKFVNGLAPVLTGGFVNGKWGYIDPEGSFVIKPQFDGALPFSEGLAAVDVKTGMGYNWGYINSDGEMVIKPSGYEKARDFSEGLAAVEHGGFGWRFIDKQGDAVVRRVNGREKIEFAEPFRGNHARVSLAGLTSFGHQGGTMDFSVRGAEWIIIDRTGKQIWPGPEVVAEPSPVAPPEGYEAFETEWSGSFFGIAYPEGWTATDLNKITGFVEGVSFVKNKKAAQALYEDGGMSFATGQKVRLVTDGNVIINVAVQPEDASNLTPEKFIDMMVGTVLNDAVEESIRTFKAAGKKAVVRSTIGADADGRHVTSFQIATKRDGRIISVSAFMPAAPDEQVEEVITKMLESLQVTVK